MVEHTAEDLMTLVERGSGLNVLDRTRLLLSFLHPEESPGSLDGLPLGECDRRLLEARAQRFGSTTVLTCRCGSCDSDYELPIDLAAILDYGAAGPVNEAVSVCCGSKTYQVSPVRFMELDAIALEPKAEERERMLLRAAVKSVQSSDGALAPVAPSRIPKSHRVALSKALDQADPLAVIVFPMTCSVCGTDWAPRLEPADLLWRDLEQECSEIIDDVRVLAQTFGWRELDILTMSPVRRRAYSKRLRERGDG
ncbi:MAG: hypothetical protein JKP96_04830 [Oceanicaulis sp.]|jgi:hypothetical protein|nr:hypothetical protein [Oceanicaulis sp.]